MTNTTDQYWTFGGVSLNQPQWNIRTFGGSRWNLPPVRGSNITVLRQAGQVHRAKTIDSRTIVLKMWTAGIDPTSGQPSSNPRLAFNDNLDTLRNLFANLGTQEELVRRWWVTVDSTPTLVAATALAEVVSMSDLAMQGPFAAEFDVELLLADSFFYGSAITEDLEVDTPTVITNPGQNAARAKSFSIVLHGPLTNPRVTNSTPNPDIWVSYTGSIADGDFVTIDVDAFVAITDEDLNVTDKIHHSGSPFLMSLRPGANTLELTADSGAGHAVVSFAPGYL